MTEFSSFSYSGMEEL